MTALLVWWLGLLVPILASFLCGYAFRAMQEARRRADEAEADLARTIVELAVRERAARN